MDFNLFMYLAENLKINNTDTILNCLPNANFPEMIKKLKRLLKILEVLEFQKNQRIKKAENLNA